METEKKKDFTVFSQAAVIVSPSKKSQTNSRRKMKSGKSSLAPISSNSSQRDMSSQLMSNQLSQVTIDGNRLYNRSIDTTGSAYRSGHILTRSSRNSEHRLVPSASVDKKLLRHVASHPILKKPTCAVLSQGMTLKNSRNVTPEPQVSASQLLSDQNTLEAMRKRNDQQNLTRARLKNNLRNIEEHKDVSNLQHVFESTILSFVEGKWNNGEGKKRLVNDSIYLERLFLKFAQHTINKFQVDYDEIWNLREQVTKQTEEIKSYRLMEEAYGATNSKMDIQMKKINERRDTYNYDQKKWNLEQAKLEQEVERLSKEIEEHNRNSDAKSLSQQLEESQNLAQALRLEYKRSKESHKIKIYDLQNKLGAAREKIKKLKQKVADLTEIKDNFDYEIKQREDNVASIRERMDQSKESLFMMSEDFTRIATIQQKLVVLNGQYTILKNKYNQLELNSILGSNNSVNENFTVNLKDAVFDAVTNNKAEHEFQQDQTDQWTNSTNLRYKYESVKLEKYAIKRPSFAELVRTHLPTNNHEKFSPPFNQWLIITIRGILDSKFYEHWMSSEEWGRKPSRFPEFCFSWLGQFHVNETSRQVEEREVKLEEVANKARVELLFAVEQEKIRNMWEIHTFREFLMEEL